LGTVVGNCCWEVLLGTVVGHCCCELLLGTIVGNWYSELFKITATESIKPRAKTPIKYSKLYFLNFETFIDLLVNPC
jgi:hypothetical protein